MKDRGGKSGGRAVEAEYSRLASHYDSRWHFYIEATARRTLERVELADDARILDLGCGTGVMLAELLRRNANLRLSGLDPVAGMLDIARARLPASVQLQQGDAEILPFGDASFDKVLCCSVLHYLRDPLRALGEINRVLVPGGELVLTDWCVDYWSIRLLDVWLRFRNAAHHRTCDAARLQQLLEGAGFEGVVVERYRIDWFWGMMTARCHGALAGSARQGPGGAAPEPGGDGK